MRVARSKLLPLALVAATFLSGCFKAEPPPTTSSTADGPTNACTPYPKPAIERDDDAYLGSNAFAYVLGLICDHSGGSARERPRVPGTPAHSEGAAFLADALRANGFTPSFQNFSGEQYEDLVRAKPTSSAYSFYNGHLCDDDELARLRGLSFANVIGQGGTPGGPIFLLLAHWDSKRFAESSGEPVLGANDGASGVGVLLEFARVVQPAETRFEIRILFTDGEDGFEDCHPLAGSMFFADQLGQADRARLSQGRILLLDMVGDADVSFYKGCGSDDDLAERIWSAAQDLGVTQFKQNGSCNVVDDHTPFEESGLATVDVIAYPPFPEYWHTTRDTPDKLDEDMLDDMGRVLERVLRDLNDELPGLP